MKIIKGKQPRPQKVVIYGTEGVGKSTLASQFPAPIFIDCEGGTDQMDVDRFEVPVMHNQLLACLQNIPDGYKTLVIDTVDWAERLVIDGVCTRHKKDGIEDFGYGKGYQYLKEEFQKLLDLLSNIAKTHNVVLVAHSQIRKFELPDQAGAFDKYELKLAKTTAPLVKEWCDMMLFLNYYTLVDVDSQSKKARASGGKERVIYTAHSAAWDAKNRHGLDDMVPAEFDSIAHCIPAGAAEGASNQGPAEPLLSFAESDVGAVNEYLVSIGWIQAGQSYKDLPTDKQKQIASKKASFLEKAGVGL